MNTPLMELIEWITNEHAKFPIDERYNPSDDIIAKATELLEKERRIIVDANIAGMEFIPVDPNRYDEDGQDYYTKNFTNESK